MLIATKVGMELNGLTGLPNERIAKSVHASLPRLRTDYIDLYFAHRDDTEMPLEVSLTAFNK